MRPDSGFSLVEVVVALGVFSIAALSLMQLNLQSAQASSLVEQRFLARVVADNQLAQTFVDTEPPVQGVEQGEAEQFGRTLYWTRIITQSPRDGLLIVRVEVRAEEGGPALATATTLKANSV
ncbi:MAG: type II secretion system minor pseudopilin GspI [Pseudomonadota bacterium]